MCEATTHPRRPRHQGSVSGIMRIRYDDDDDDDDDDDFFNLI